MPFTGKDASGATIYFQEISGAGTLGDPYQVIRQPATPSAENLTGAGAGTAQSFSGYSSFTVAVTVTLNGSSAVAFRFEHRPQSGAGWSNCSVSEDDISITVDGTYSYTWQGSASDVRFNWLTETGGTSGTIAVYWRFAP